MEKVQLRDLEKNVTGKLYNFRLILETNIDFMQI